ncbi:putative protein tyrosine phosphatase type IVA protein 1 [Paratrimastix pyriformis]|uniref:Uncharacterized protein n=1 Tax=Paratrimastix pyriformis TaxID=342808 RepID=A0ABQ8UM56_9EUKA|nr:putative protein tyrosine phosphatase type IVA protein 1 [Paratrimastix pyriformis]
MDSPTRENLPVYIEEMKKHNVTHLVRVCEPAYPPEPVEQAGITVHEWNFPDGEEPPSAVIDRWLDLVEACEAKKGEARQTIAVHCVAGLGRAPVLVAIALIEHGLDPLDVIQLIRSRRHGAMNPRQARFVEKYKPRRKKECVIM